MEDETLTGDAGVGDHGERVVGGFAHVHDQWLADVPCRPDVGAQTRLLQRDVLGAVVVIKAGFADCDDQRIGRQSGQLRLVRFAITDLIGVYAHGCRDLPVAGSQLAHDRRVAQAHAHAQEMLDADLCGLGEQRVDPLQRGVDQVKVAVGIDQHAYMVCVWRSLLSAPAR